MVGVAVKVTADPEQIVFVEDTMETDATKSGFKTIEIAFESTVVVAKHGVAFDDISTVTISPLLKVLVLKLAEV